MNDFQTIDDYPATIHSYGADEAIEDGFLLDLMPKEQEVLPIKELNSMDEYLRSYGKILGKKAIHALAPLHVPNRDPLPDFSECLREPFPAQQHVIAAAVKMLDEVGNGFIVGEMGPARRCSGCSPFTSIRSGPASKAGVAASTDRSSSAPTT